MKKKMEKVKIFFLHGVFRLLLVVFVSAALPSCILKQNEQYLADLKSDNVILQSKALYYLGINKEKKAIPVISALLKNTPSKPLMGAAIKALGDMGPGTPIDLLLDLLKNEDDEIKLVVIEALGKIKDPKAINPLFDLIDNKHVHFAAIWALGSIQSDQAIPLLTSLLHNQDGLVRYHATLALEKIGTKDRLWN